MTVTLEPELEDKLRHKAAEQGQDSDTYLRHLVEAALDQPMPPIIHSQLTTEEFVQSWLEGVERAKSRDLPSSDSDFRREDIYDNEW